MRSIHYLLLSLLMVVGTIADADIYRWVDEQGKVHFGDRPRNNEAERLNLPGADPGEDRVDQQQLDAQRSASRQRLLDSYEEERESKRIELEKRQAEEKKQEQNCIYSRDLLRNYESSPSIYQPLPGGGRRYYSPSERRSEIDRVRAQVEHWCGG